MALLTRSGVNKILRRIMETGGMTDAMEEDIKRLQDDFDEREGVLRKYGEVYDGEDNDDYEYIEREIETGDGEYKTKYEEMKQKYLDRFFGGVDVSGEEVKEEQTEDVKDDGKVKSFDELFEKKEG